MGRLEGMTGLLLAVLLVACGGKTNSVGHDGQGDVPQAVQFFAEGKPAKLSDWNILKLDGKRLSLNAGVVPYDLNTPLFTDYAHKLRTIWMPEGSSAQYRADAALDFPVGTVISKTFYYPLPEGQAWDGKSVARTDASSHNLLQNETLDLAKVRLVETRILVHREKGWVAIPYVWNAEQTEAVLMRTGQHVPLELVDAAGEREALAYQVPDENQCAGCHAVNNKSRQIAPIGPKAQHLNRDFDYIGGTENQLQHLQRVGYLTGVPEAPSEIPRLANWQDAAHASLEDRARGYLDINCGHCHSATGAAVTSGMWMDASTTDRLKLGFCKQPIAAGTGTGDRLYDIVPGQAEASVLHYRMASNDPSAMMPELGRAVVHREGVELIREWINAQQGNCDS